VRAGGAARGAHLAELLAGSGVEPAAEVARELWLLSEGAISLMLVHGDRGYAAAAARAARTLLYRSPKRSGQRQALSRKSP